MFFCLVSEELFHEVKKSQPPLKPSLKLNLKQEKTNLVTLLTMFTQTNLLSDANLKNCNENLQISSQISFL